MQPYKIMVAIDFSEDSDHALEQAMRLAARLHGQLELVHVVAPRPALPTDVVSAEPMDSGEVERAREALKAAKARVEARHIPVATHLAVGQVVYGLIDTIREMKPELVIVGSHGKGAIKRAFLGSVSESLVRRSTAPVLVVPSLSRAHEPVAA
jgi:nucleotide-binding universal stress UspA family protein